MKYTISKKYTNKIAFITGSGSGLGKALALALAREAWLIGITDRNEAALNQTALAVQESGGKVITYIFDVANSEAYRIAFTDFIKQAGSIDLLINNAGVGEGSVFEKYSLENWNWIVGINMMGVIHGCHYAIPIMKQQQSGYIVNIASAAAFASAPSMSPYNVTKAGVLSLSESLYAELKAFNIGVSVVMPTFFKTNIAQYARGGAEEKLMAEYLLERSGISADEVADEILRKVGKEKFYIILPFLARFLFFVKRIFPKLVLYANAKFSNKRDQVIVKLKKRWKSKEK